MHVYRLRELLFNKIDDMYLSTGSIHENATKSVPSFPSFSELVSSESYNDLAYALNCDMEFQQFIDQFDRQSKLVNKQKKSKSEEELLAEMQQERQMALQFATDNNQTVTKDSLQEMMDSRQLFHPDKFSLKSLDTVLQCSSPVLPQCVKSITFSAFNPPPGNRKLIGDLFYLHVETMEGKKVHITATPNGFYINASKDNAFDPSPAPKSATSHTLLGLLWSVSPTFKKEFPNLLSARTKKHPFEVTPVPFQTMKWLEPASKHQYDANRAEEALFTVLGNDPRVQQREWNEEYQSCKELASGTMEERIIRDRNLFKIHCDFVDAATKGARAVVDKSLLPINPMDPKPAQVYIQNNIFFSYAVDSKEDGDVKKFEMDQNAYANANNDLRGVVAFNEADVRGIHTLASSIIDYRGYRVIAQSIIPGILQNDQGSKHVYGSIDEGKSFVWDEKYHNLMKEAAEKLFLKEHTVLDKEGKEFTFCCPVECKGIIGSDGRFYILDLVRITPRDSNFVSVSNAILRPELLKSFARFKVAAKMAALKKDEKETTTTTTSETTEQQQDQQATTLQQATPNNSIEQDLLKTIRFNPDVLTSHKLVGDEKADLAEVAELAKYLKETVVPSFVKDVANFENVPLDGMTLTEAMHQKGINMRYLGEVATLAQAQNLPFLHVLALQEMVVRAAKQEFNIVMRNSSDEQLGKNIHHFINALFGSMQEKKKASAVRTKIARLVEQKFNYTLADGFSAIVPPLSTLRSFCLRTGLKILPKEYNFQNATPFAMTDIQGLDAVVKHSTPKSSTAAGLLDVGKQQLAMGRYESAYEFLSQAIVMFQQVKGPMNKEVANCFSYLATILFHASDLPQAILHQHKALVISRRVLGIDHSAIVHMHQVLGMLCQNIGQIEMALKHYLRARYLCQLVFGSDHPDMVFLLTNIAMMYQDLGDVQKATRLLQDALQTSTKLFGAEHLQTASIHHALAAALSFLRQYKEAMNHERKHYQVVLTKFGAQDQRVTESKMWLDHFISKAVQVSKEQLAEEQEFVKLRKQASSLFGLPNAQRFDKEMPAEILNLLLKQEKK